MHVISAIMEIMFGATDWAILSAADIMTRAEVMNLTSYIIDEIPI